MKDTSLPIELKQHLADKFAKADFVRHLGITLQTIEPGMSVLLMGATDNLKQADGIVHGGAVATLADTAAAFAAMSLLGPDETIVTVDMTIHYLRPLKSGHASAHARVLRAGRRLVTVAVEVIDDQQELVATTLLTCARRVQKAINNQ